MITDYKQKYLARLENPQRMKGKLSLKNASRNQTRPRPKIFLRITIPPRITRHAQEMIVEEILAGVETVETTAVIAGTAGSSTGAAGGVRAGALFAGCGRRAI